MAVGAKRGGSRKGIPNKTTAGVKSNLLQVFEDIGGVKYFGTWAKDNPTEFYKHYMKLMPTEVIADVEARINIIINKPL